MRWIRWMVLVYDRHLPMIGSGGRKRTTLLVIMRYTCGFVVVFVSSVTRNIRFTFENNKDIGENRPGHFSETFIYLLVWLWLFGLNCAQDCERLKFLDNIVHAFQIVAANVTPVARQLISTLGRRSALKNNKLKR